jgi:hypothetical protein
MYSRRGVECRMRSERGERTLSGIPSIHPAIQPSSHPSSILHRGDAPFGPSISSRIVGGPRGTFRYPRRPAQSPRGIPPGAGMRGPIVAWGDCGFPRRACGTTNTRVLRTVGAVLHCTEYVLYVHTMRSTVCTVNSSVRYSSPVQYQYSTGQLEIAHCKTPPHNKIEIRHGMHDLRWVHITVPPFLTLRCYYSTELPTPYVRSPKRLVPPSPAWTDGAPGKRCLNRHVRATTHPEGASAVATLLLDSLLHFHYLITPPLLPF